MRIKSICLLVLTTGVAHADDDVPPAAEATAAPGFVNLDRQDAASRAGGDVTYLALDSESDVTLLRIDLHGHYVDPKTGFGGYAQVPIATYFGDGESGSAFGNLEIGGIFVPKLKSPEVGVVLHAGITLPTGPSPNDEDGIVGAVAGYLRPADLYQVIPRSATLRLGASPMVRSGKVFGRVDLGLDVNLYIDDGDSEFSQDVDSAAHFAVGGGLDLGGAAVMGELSVLRIFEDDAESLVVGAVSVRGTGPKIQPYGALSIPLSPDDLGDVIDLGLTAGVEGGF